MNKVVRDHLARFFKNNPEFQMVTFKRPDTPTQRNFYTRTSSESYGRMPQTCEIVQAILNRHLRVGETVGESTVDNIFREIHDEITSKFRNNFEEVLGQKYRLIGAVTQALESLTEEVNEARTVKPGPPKPIPEITVDMEEENGF